MFKKYKLSLFSLLLLFLCSSFSVQPIQAQEKEGFKNMRDALFSSRMLRGNDAPRNLTWIDGGNRYSYMNRGTKSTQIRAYNPKTGKDVLIFSAQGMVFPDTGKPFEYRSYQWSKDSNYIVFRTRIRPVYRNSGVSDYFLYSLKTGELTLIANDARTAELSPNGKMIGYERNGDMFVYFIKSGIEKQLTNSGKEFFYNGRFGWVYEEEFGLTQAWAWSHDSKYIAYWQTDESEVPIYLMMDYSGHHVKYDSIPFPQVGDTNPTVRIGVLNVHTGKNEWMNIELGNGYIPRIYWTAKPGLLAVVHLNRKQNHLKLYFCEVTSGQCEMRYEEKSKYWIDIFDFFAGVEHLFYFPEDHNEFWRISDRDGWSHLYRYNYQGELISEVIHGKFEVSKVHVIDYEDKRVYYTSTEVSPLQRHLYSINFDGTHKAKLTETPGTHNINMSPNAKYYVDSYSNINTPPQVELRAVGGGVLKVLDDNKDVYEYLEDHKYSGKQLLTFTTKDGQQLDVSVIKPFNFDPDKEYPLIMNIYGGPASQGVYNSWATSGWVQYLAQQGYVIANVNNRGSGGYGRHFEKMVYKNLGYWESKDFVATAKYLAQKEWVDEDNMAIRGHSYGGYMTLYTMTTHPGVFDVGIATAPVTDWRLYDTIYTERYMGLLKNNKEGYIESSVTAHAANFEGHLLLSHAIQDVNVHIQNTWQVMNAFQQAGVENIHLQIYPPGSHGVAYDLQTYVLLYDSYVDFLNRFLKNGD